MVTPRKKRGWLVGSGRVWEGVVIHKTKRGQWQAWERICEGWSQLKQRRGDRIGKGSVREWSQLEQRLKKGVGDRGGRGSVRRWSHLEQRGGDRVWRGSVIGW